MPNMSYCRFHNTLNDMRACITALEERNISSDEERNKARVLIEEFLEFCVEEEIIVDYKSKVVERLITECNEQEE